MTETKNTNQDTGNISRTYTEVAKEFCISETHRDDIHFNQTDEDAIMSFAKYLDSMPNLMPHLELMVMRKAREIDREMMLMLIAEIPAERVKEIAREVTERHKHTKTSIT